MPKRKCKFTNELKQEFPYLKDTGNGKVLCNHCGSIFSIVHGGRADVNNHLGSKKHKVAVEAAASSSRVTSFFKDVGSASVATLALAAKEATFAYHTATHGQSFRSSDCTSKLVSKLFEPKFSLGKTTVQVICMQIIFGHQHKLVQDKLLLDLNIKLNKAIDIHFDAEAKGFTRKLIHLVL